MLTVAVPPQVADPARATDTARSRLTISVLSLGGLAIGLLGLWLDAELPRQLGLLVFCLIGIGSAPWQLNTTLRLPARGALAILTGLAVLTLGSMVMLATQHWRPFPAFTAVAAACASVHLAGAWRALRDNRSTGLARRDDRSTGRALRESRSGDNITPRRPSPATVCAVTGAVLCLTAALTHRHIDPDYGGFVLRIGPVWLVGLALVASALVVARRETEADVAIPVILLLLVLTVTPAVVYDGPRSQSAAKHVDLVQQIRAMGRLNSVDIYNSWPGFFASMAWLCDITGIGDPMRLATFWPPLVGLFRLTTLRYMFGQVLPDGYRCWIAVALALLPDTIGTDYFAPQSIGFVIGIAIFGLALSSRRTAPRLILIFAAGCLLAVTHQLSPYVVGGVLGVLVVFRQVKPWWTPLCVLGPAGGWTFLHADALTGFISLRELGRLENFLPPPTVASAGLERLPIVSATVYALLLGIGILGVTALVALLRNRRDLWAWAFASCPAVGLVLVALNAYGREGIFRAALFGLPWLALLAAHAFASSERLRTRVWMLGVVAALEATFLVAAFGLDATNVTRPSDVAACRYFQSQAHSRPQLTHYLLNLGAGDLPVPPRTLGNQRSLTRADLDEPVRQEPGLRPVVQVETLTAKLLEYTGEPPGQAELYAIWSPVSSYYAWAYALQLPEEFAALRDGFQTAPYWQVAYTGGGTVVFRFVPARYPGGSR